MEAINYRNWKIEKADYGYYEATNLNDCDAFMKQSKSMDELKTEIDEEQLESVQPHPH